jgi:ABC-type Na+ efflux pump permease subunit
MNALDTNLDVESARACAASGNAAALRAANWLSLAAAPTFAVMALLTGVLGGAPLDVLCSSAQDASPLSGMVPMYLLMSVFHSAPWLKLISGR